MGNREYCEIVNRSEGAIIANYQGLRCGLIRLVDITGITVGKDRPIETHKTNGQRVFRK